MEGSDCTGGATGQGLFRSAQGLQVVGGGRTCLLVTAELFTCYCSKTAKKTQLVCVRRGVVLARSSPFSFSACFK